MTTKANLKEVDNVFKNLFISKKNEIKKKPTYSFSEKNKTNVILPDNSDKNKTILFTNSNIKIEDTIKKNTKQQKSNSYELKKQLALNIDKLEEYEKVQIFHIIKNAGEVFSKNRRGVFFDLLKFKETTIQNLNQFIKSTTAYRK